MSTGPVEQSVTCAICPNLERWKLVQVLEEVTTSGMLLNTKTEKIQTENMTSLVERSAAIRRRRREAAAAIQHLRITSPRPPLSGNIMRRMTVVKKWTCPSMILLKMKTLGTKRMYQSMTWDRSQMMILSQRSSPAPVDGGTVPLPPHPGGEAAAGEGGAPAPGAPGTTAAVVRPSVAVSRDRDNSTSGAPPGPGTPAATPGPPLLLLPCCRRGADAGLAPHAPGPLRERGRGRGLPIPGAGVGAGRAIETAITIEGGARRVLPARLGAVEEEEAAGEIDAGLDRDPTRVPGQETGPIPGLEALHRTNPPPPPPIAPERGPVPVPGTGTETGTGEGGGPIPVPEAGATLASVGAEGLVPDPMTGEGANRLPGVDTTRKRECLVW